MYFYGNASAHGALGSSDRFLMVDSLSYFSRPWYELSCLWDGAYKRTLAANRKE